MAEWSKAFEIVGILGGVIFGAGGLAISNITLSRNTKATELDNFAGLMQMHRDLWEGASQRPELKRIFEKDADVSNVGPTVQEEEFLNIAFGHFQFGWGIAKSSAFVTLDELRDDLHDFFSFPLRRVVWKKLTSGRNSEFIRFVDREIERHR